jgi:hypothetical protein
MEKDKRIQVRLNSTEYQVLKDYCQFVHRSQSDVLRELVRSLPVLQEMIGHFRPSNDPLSLPTLRSAEGGEG